jgi:hypothetical protein
MSLTAKQTGFLLLVLFGSLLIAAVAAELLLGVTEKRAKKSIPDYADVKRPQGLGWGGFLKENLAIQVTDGLGGRVRWTNNAQGFRSDREFSRRPPPGVLRILSLGDSFTAGYRVGQDETFSARLEEWINRKKGKAEVLVVETEEPATALYYLDRFGLKLKPQIVLLGITLGNDIAQAYQALDPGGQYLLTITDARVRLDENPRSRLGFQQLAAYKIPPDYLKSEDPVTRFIRHAGLWLKKRRLLRRFYQDREAITSWGHRDPPGLFDANNGFGMFTQPPPPEIQVAYKRLFRILEAFSLICRQQGIIFAVQLFPQRYQVQPEDWDRAAQDYGLKKSRFDLMAPNRRISEFCRARSIDCLDPTRCMAELHAATGRNLYLPRGDMHWSRAGHAAFFACSLPALTQLVQAGFRVVAGEQPPARPPEKTLPPVSRTPKAGRTRPGAAPS